MDHAHPLDLLRREKTELNLLDGAQRRLGVGEVNVRHVGDYRRAKTLLGRDAADGTVDGNSASRKRFPGSIRRAILKRAQATMREIARSWPVGGLWQPSPPGRLGPEGTSQGREKGVKRLKRRFWRTLSLVERYHDAGDDGGGRWGMGRQGDGEMEGRWRRLPQLRMGTSFLEPVLGLAFSQRNHTLYFTAFFIKLV